MSSYYKTKETAIKHIKAGENFGRKAFELFRDDKEVVLEAVGMDSEVISSLSKRMKDDEDIIIKAIKACDRYKHSTHNEGKDWIKTIPQHLLDNNDIARLIVSHTQQGFAFLSDRLRDYKSYAHTAILNANNNAAVHCIYKRMSDRLRDDKELALLALSKGVNVYRNMSDRLRSDKTIAYEVLSSVDHIPAEYWNDVPSKLFNDEEFIVEVVKRFCKCTYHTTRDWGRGDVYIHDEPMKSFYWRIDDRLRNSEDFIRKIIKVQNSGIGCLFAASDRLRDMEHIVYNAIKTCGDNFRFASERMRNEYYYASAAIKDTQSSKPFEFASGRLRDDIELLYEASQMEDGSEALQYASNRIQDKVKAIGGDVVQAVQTLYEMESLGSVGKAQVVKKEAALAL